MSAWGWFRRILAAVPGAVAAGRALGGLLGRGGGDEQLDEPLGELESERALREAQERREAARRLRAKRQRHGRRSGNGRSER